MEKERQNKISFLDVEVVREQGKFTTTISRKPSLSGVYSNFESFLPPVCKFGMVYGFVFARIWRNSMQNKNSNSLD